MIRCNLDLQLTLRRIRKKESKNEIDYENYNAMMWFSYQIYLLLDFDI